MKKTKYLFLKGFLVFCLFGGLALGGADNESIEFCQLVKVGERYEGKEVTVFATFRYGIEWAELYCLGCSDLIWVDFDDDSLTTSSISELSKRPKGSGTVNVRFTGKLTSGFEDYRFRIKVTRVESVTVIEKSGSIPTALDKKYRDKLCKRKCKKR